MKMGGRNRATFVLTLTLFCSLQGGCLKRDHAPESASKGQAAKSSAIASGDLWEKIFFQDLERYLRAANLKSLKEFAPTEKDDIEIRFWISGLPDQLDGILLRRIGGRWSGVRVYRAVAENGEVRKETLAKPKSGWDLVWEKFVARGGLVLPDASKINCSEVIVDGVWLVVELNVDQSYRAYHYPNPAHARCEEAKRVLDLFKMLFDEFNLENKF